MRARPLRPPRLALLAPLVLGLAACRSPIPGVSQAPIPVGWTGGLHAFGSVGDQQFPMLIDTGSVLTTRGVDGAPHIDPDQSITLHDINGVARARWIEIDLLSAPLGTVGMPGRTVDVGGVLAGDLLQRYSLALRYGDRPTISLLPPESGCSCALADACEVVLPFVLAGGGTLTLDGNVHLYPPTRVTVDTCVGPVVDPTARACDAATLGFTPEGGPGIDVRMLVATGFGGVLLGANAWDRMCESRRRYLGRACDKTAAQLLAEAPPVDIRFASPDQRITRAALVKLGEPAMIPALAALVLVGRERGLGACQELARSRRLRAAPEQANCNDASITSGCLQRLSGSCSGDPDRCSDRNQPAAGFLEIDEPLDVWVVDDSATILREANFDVRPILSDVEGVIGSDLLARLEARIDYPNRRVIVHCAPGSCGCRAFPRYACAEGDTPVGDCGPDARALCNPPSSIIKGGPTCVPAPIHRQAGIVFDMGDPTCNGRDAGSD